MQFVPRHGAGLLLGVLRAAPAALTALTTHTAPAAHGASTVCGSLPAEGPLRRLGMQ